MKKEIIFKQKSSELDGGLKRASQKGKKIGKINQQNSLQTFPNSQNYDLFTHISSGVAVYEAVNGGKDFIFKDFNKTAEKIDHISRKDVIGRKVTEVFPGIREMRLLETFRRVWKTGKSENHPLTLYKDNKLTGWRENYIYKLPSGEIVAIYNDRTEEKKDKVYEKWLASFPEINPLLVLEIDEKLNIIYINPSAKKQFPEIEINSASHPFFAGTLNVINVLKKGKQKEITIEVKVGERWYSQVICSVSNNPDFRIYAHEITEEKKDELVHQILYEIIQTAAKTQDLHEFFNHLQNLLGKIIFIDNFFVFLYDDKKADYSIIYSSAKYDSTYPVLQMKKCLIAENFKYKHTSFLTKEQLNKLKKSVIEHGNKPVPLSGLCIPLKTSDQVIGVCSIFDYEKEDRFKDSDLQLFDLIAGHVAEIVQRKQAQISLLRRNRMLRMLSEMNKELVHITDEKELLNIICEILIYKGGYRMAWVGYIQQDQKKAVIPVAQKGFEKGYLDSAEITWADTKRGQGPTGTAIRTRMVSIARNIQEDPNFKPWRDAAIKRGYKSSIAIPLINGENTIGTLNIYSNEPEAFDEEEVTLLTEMAGDLSYGINSLRIREAHIAAEKILRESEEKFKFVFENSVVGKSLTSISGEIHVNNAFCQILGYSPEEMQKKRWQDITHPDDIEKTQEELNSLLSKERESIRFTKRFIKKDGSIVWGDVLTSLRWDEKQNPLYFITAIIDITERIEMEQKLKESNDFQQSLFETTSMATSILEKDKTISKVNHAYELLTGYSKQEIEWKKKWIELVDPDFLDLMMDYHNQRRIEPDSVPKQYEFRLVTKSNEKKDIFITIDVIPGTQKSIASFLDITELKQSEKALREANTIINRSPAVAFLWKNNPGWPVEFVSSNVNRLFGFRTEEFISGKISYSERIYKNDLERVIEEVSKNSSIPGLNSFSHLPYRIITKNNQVKWVEDVSFIRRNDKGKITHYEGIVFDITDRMKIEEKLQVSENKYRSVVEYAPLLVSNFLPDGTITFVNKAYCDFFEKRFDDFIGTKIFSTIIEDDKVFIKEKLKSCTNDSPIIVMENRVDRHGEERWMRWTDCAFFDENGKITFYQSYGQDIHEQKHVEHLLQALNRATIGMETVLTTEGIFNVVAEELKKLETSCMFLQLDEKQKKLLTKQLYFDSKLLKKAEQMVGLQHEKFSFSIESIKQYKEAVYQQKVLFINNTEQLFYQMLPKSLESFAKPIIKLLGASKSIVAPLIVEGKIIGIFSVQSDFLTENDVPIFTVFADQLAGAWKRVELLQDLKKTIDGTILTIAATVEMRDPYTAGHQTRVANLATAIAGELHLSQKQIESIHMAGIIHDLGKINVPAEILSKPGKISNLELEIIRTHPQVGYDLLKKIEFPWPIAQIVLQHHEKIDGSGYPQGLKRDKIMIEARILCVADIVEAMSSHRPYRPSLGIEAALTQIKKDRGRLLDPQVVDACLKLFAQGYKFPEVK